MLTHDVMEVLAGGGALCLGVALVVLVGRDPQPASDEHTVADTSRRRLRPMLLGPGATITPLGPPELTAPLDELPAPEPARIWEHMVARQWLVELGERARADLAVTR